MKLPYQTLGVLRAALLTSEHLRWGQGATGKILASVPHMDAFEGHLVDYY